MVVGWIAVPCAVLLAMVVAYYVSEDGYKAKAADMMLAFVQNLGILSVVSDLLLHETSWMELEVYRIICVTGKFLQSGFTTMCNIGLIPFMCMRHPNGILKYSNTFCGSAEHGTMQLFGVLVLVLSRTSSFAGQVGSNMVLGVT